MNQRLIVSSALASALALGLLNTAAAADEKGKEKCYGIAKAGQNDCANLSGTHSCAGQTKADMDANDWKYVAKGTCKTMNGLTAEEAKAKLADTKKKG
ncbi:BufA1 family periplasmic bufferin-type metallophore [Ideonella sp. BN130291]|uniref:BufA1 family periplasmic bufferin-type metallophore n=1 Tax=Ideonella sp. BN130291 TaxID=3112940 RepID=UPI002E26FE1E|nr:DUF2282 domain-containing protein [Ideonella sp. BN130291]